MYQQEIEYAIIEESINKASAKKILDEFIEKSKHKSTNFIRDAILSC